MSAVDELSPREFEILRMILDAKSTDEIASAFNLSPKTVANYHYEIKSKLGVRSDIELVYFCMRQGLVASLAVPGAASLQRRDRGLLFETDDSHVGLDRAPIHAALGKNATIGATRVRRDHGLERHRGLGAEGEFAELVRVAAVVGELQVDAVGGEDVDAGSDVDILVVEFGRGGEELAGRGDEARSHVERGVVEEGAARSHVGAIGDAPRGDLGADLDGGLAASTQALVP